MAKSSHSEVETFLMCERRHYYSYGLAVDSKVTNEALFRGQCGHAGLQGYYEALKNEASFDNAINWGLKQCVTAGTEYEAYNKDVLMAEIQMLLIDYFEYWEDVDKDLEILETEYKVKIPTGNGNMMTVVVDLLTREKNVGIVATDHKFTYDFYNPDVIDLSPQLVKYLAALRSVDIPVVRLQYNEIRTRSTKENREDRSKLFKRTPFRPSKARVSRTMKEHFAAADRIMVFKEMPIEEWSDKALRVANRMVCQSCQYKDLCTSELNDWGINSILHHEFDKKVPRSDISKSPKYESVASNVGGESTGS